MGLKIFTDQDVQNNFLACYAVENKLSPGWAGTALDMLNMTNIPQNDRMWAVMRTALMPKEKIRDLTFWILETYFNANSIEEYSFTKNQAILYYTGELSNSDKNQIYFELFKKYEETSNETYRIIAYLFLPDVEKAINRIIIDAMGITGQLLAVTVNNTQVANEIVAEAINYFNNYGLLEVGPI